MSTPPPPPQVSPDGKFYWDGERWVPMDAQAVPAMPMPTATQMEQQAGSGAAIQGIAPEAALQQEIGRYVKKGFRVVSQTSRNAQLVKPKKFSFWWALIWFVLAIVPFVIYLIYYAGKKDRQVYLTVDEQGRVTEARH